MADQLGGHGQTRVCPGQGQAGRGQARAVNDREEGGIRGGARAVLAKAEAIGRVQRKIIELARKLRQRGVSRTSRSAMAAAKARPTA